ncbi:hypothetical protein ETAA8_25390 [Anatilimnocola aggregata]|uniref:Uncharacterized protein n=1 Tax=Anatilimnocola aggregata TaxID=2528021 RepID=A0A517YB71_9BACT|nr:hypothetical protein [Anatilimnocola aggregata]QDU27451.1 hypothetical protein ETAA8_25390 [Anatilimnocola aggregata]
MFCNLNFISTILLAGFTAAIAAGQQPASDDPFAPAPTVPTTNQPAPANPDDPFAPTPKPALPPVVPAPGPGIVPPPQPRVQPVPTPQPANPAPVNPDAEGANDGNGVIVASPGRFAPWGNTKGTWVPFYYNKQWHLYRSWCQ